MMLNIRNMQSDRCKSYVQNELMKLGIQYKSVSIGEVKLAEDISPEKIQQMEIALSNAGLELMRNKNILLIEKIKSAIHQFIYSTDELQKPNISRFISTKANCKYSNVSKLFAYMKHVTIEKYIISEKIEYVKKMLTENKISLTDIAFTLKYSSVSHLSSQFKKITGLTPSMYRDLFFKKHK